MAYGFGAGVSGVAPVPFQLTPKGDNMLTQDAKKRASAEVKENPVYVNDKEVKEEISTVDDENEITVTADLEDLKMNEIRKIAKDKGIKTGIRTTKDKLIKLIKGD